MTSPFLGKKRGVKTLRLRIGIHKKMNLMM